MQINGRKIGAGLPPYIVAELSGNHCGKLEKALELISAAKKAGADAAKIQVYRPESITLDCDNDDFIIKDGPWKGRKLYDLYSSAYTPWIWMPTLFEHAKKENITLFASVFDEEAILLMEQLGCPAYKIASMEITDIPLIKKAAKTGKPVMISTGMASDVEIIEATVCVTGDLAILHCVSGYPTPVAEANLHRLREKFPYPIGISDHTRGAAVPIAATALGASIIERHLCLSCDDPSEDSAFSSTPQEFAVMVYAVHEIYWAMQPSKAESEESSRQLRRSLYVVKDMKEGEPFCLDNVQSIRPSYGLPPKLLPRVLQMVATRDIKRGTPLSYELGRYNRGTGA